MNSTLNIYILKSTSCLLKTTAFYCQLRHIYSINEKEEEEEIS